MSQQRSMASHRVVTADGWRLDVLDLIPERAPCAVAVVGHAMMVDRRTVSRADGPSLCGTLCERGFRVLVPDLRGHGASGPTASDGADWSYHELVSDVGEYVDLAVTTVPGAAFGDFLQHRDVGIADLDQPGRTFRSVAAIQAARALVDVPAQDPEAHGAARTVGPVDAVRHGSSRGGLPGRRVGGFDWAVSRLRRPCGLHSVVHSLPSPRSV